MRGVGRFVVIFNVNDTNDHDNQTQADSDVHGNYQEPFELLAEVSVAGPSTAHQLVCEETGMLLRVYLRLMHDSQSAQKQGRKPDRVDDHNAGGFCGVVGDGFQLDDSSYDFD
jgi:hypothetical protein